MKSVNTNSSDIAEEVFTHPPYRYSLPGPAHTVPSVFIGNIHKIDAAKFTKCPVP